MPKFESIHSTPVTLFFGGRQIYLPARAEYETNEPDVVAFLNDSADVRKVAPERRRTEGADRQEQVADRKAKSTKRKKASK